MDGPSEGAPGNPRRAAWQADNQAMWDERVPIHVASAFYDVAGFRSGRDTLQPFEAEELGPVDGQRLVHLQCHFGLDTLSWARRGARVSGLDFSGPAIEAAARLAAEVGLEAHFVAGDVYDAPLLLDGPFDVAYTGLGALNWLGDLQAWAAVVARLCRPGGLLYLVEFHPFTEVFSYQALDVAYSYFHEDEPLTWDDSPGTYAQPDATTTHNRSHEWRHPVSEVISEVLDAGFTLELFHEWPWTLFPRWPFLQRREAGTYWLPEGSPQLPLMYSLRARRLG